MNPQLRRNAISLILVLVSLGSAAYVIAAAVNYTWFYPALSQLDPRVDSIGVETDPASGNIRLRANVAVSNPTDYSGLRVYAFELRLFFVHRYLFNTSLFQDQPLIVSQTVLRSLGPRSTVGSDLVFLLSSEQSASFSQFNQAHPGQVAARTSLRVQVSTFLDPVIGRVVHDKAGDFPI